jgi:hypothetical protein
MEQQIDLETADSSRFREAIDNMTYSFYRRMRELRPDRPLSYFVDMGLWSAADVERFEARFRKGAQ